MHTNNGILFNHESPIRGETFVTRKITRGVARIALGFQEVLYLGNLNSLRDWGDARDYVRAMHLMLQQDEPGDFVIATGEQHSVREFVQLSFAETGIEVAFFGQGPDEVAQIVSIDESRLESACGLLDNIESREAHLAVGDVVVRVDPHYFRPTEVATLLGDASKARDILGWVPERSFDDLIAEMVLEDLGQAQRYGLLRAEGFDVRERRE